MATGQKSRDNFRRVEKRWAEARLVEKSCEKRGRGEKS